MNSVCLVSRVARAALCVTCVAGLLGAGAPAFAAEQSQPPRAAAKRPPSAVRQEEATDLASAWADLGRGQAKQAADKAAALLQQSPRSAAAFLLAIEADIFLDGSRTALSRYDQWVGARTLEEPVVLARIARALLYEALADRQDLRAAAEAWRALTEDGERLSPAPELLTRGGGTGLRALAAAGDEGAVQKLIADLPGEAGRSASKVQALDALGESRSPLAVQPIAEQLNDSRQEVRAAAARALGTIGRAEAAGRIRPLLSDRSQFVRARAAAALLRLGDVTGLPVLQEMAADESPATRLLAADGLASQPDASWNALVRELSANPDPEVRIGAARLIAPHDPVLAATVLNTVSNDTNPAIRDLASLAYADSVSSFDLGTLRRLLRQPLMLTKVRAAGRILSLTR